MPTGVQLTSRSQLPARRRPRPDRRRRDHAPPPRRAGGCARARGRGSRSTPARRPRRAPRRRRREATPAGPSSGDAIAERLRETRSTSVLPPSQRPSTTRIVLMAPMRRATASTSSTRSNSETLCGIVTLAPLTPSARPKRHEIVGAGGGKRQIDRVEPRRRERGVVHRRRHRVRDRRADEAVDVGASRSASGSGSRSAASPPRAGRRRAREPA